MKKRIILISGKKGSGKTTLSNALKARLLEELTYGVSFKFWQKKVPAVQVFKYADALYEAHHKVWDIVDRYKIIPREEKSRDLLEMLGDFGRARDVSLWAKITRGAVDASESPFILIDDLRYPSEMDAMPANAIRIRLECPEEIRKTRCVWGDGSAHSSETSLDDVVGIRGLPGAEGGEFDYIFHTDKESPAEIVDYLFESAFEGVIYNIRREAQDASVRLVG